MSSSNPANPSDDSSSGSVPGAEQPTPAESVAPGVQASVPPTPAAPNPATGGLFASNGARLGLIAGGIGVAVLLLGILTLGVSAASGAMNDDHGRSRFGTQDRPGGMGGGRMHDFMDDDSRDGWQSGERGSGPLGQGNNGQGFGNPNRNGQDDQLGGGPSDRGMMSGMPGGIPAIEHGDFVVRGLDGKPVTMRVVRGAVTVVNAKTITVKATDGYTMAYAISSTTKVSRNGSTATIANVVVGDTAMVLGPVSGKTVTANRINAADAANAGGMFDR